MQYGQCNICKGPCLCDIYTGHLPHVFAVRLRIPNAHQRLGQVSQNSNQPLCEYENAWLLPLPTLKRNCRLRSLELDLFPLSISQSLWKTIAYLNKHSLCWTLSWRFRSIAMRKNCQAHTVGDPKYTVQTSQISTGKQRSGTHLTTPAPKAWGPFQKRGKDCKRQNRGVCYETHRIIISGATPTKSH